MKWLQSLYVLFALLNLFPKISIIEKIETFHNIFDDSPVRDVRV